MTYVSQSCEMFGVGEMGCGEYGNAVLSLQLFSQCNIILKLKVYLQRQGNSMEQSQRYSIYWYAQGEVQVCRMQPFLYLKDYKYVYMNLYIHKISLQRWIYYIYTYITLLWEGEWGDWGKRKQKGFTFHYIFTFVSLSFTFMYYLFKKIS